jgi:hypothetical protein
MLVISRFYISDIYHISATDIRVMALALNHSDTPLVHVTVPMLPWSRASSTVVGG